MSKVWNKVTLGFRANILIGFFLLAPLVGTLWIINLVITFVSNHIVPSLWLASKYELLFRIAALIVVVAALYFVGLLTRNLIGKKVYRLADWVLTHIPVISNVYTSIRQISESLVSTQSTLFKEVVVVQFPRLGLYSIGFVTARVPEMISRKLETAASSEMICIFVPTSPNPTSGFLLMVPRSELIYLNIGVAAAMKMVISGGAASPWKSEAVSRMTLLDHIEAWLKRGETMSSPPEPPAENKPAESK
ncbi:MAG: DUF502 domain-containing protein [Kiritimatiellia bacterium]|nr:DUF502 domain-containing protein [Kiritimatiellia bacterium]